MSPAYRRWLGTIGSLDRLRCRLAFTSARHKEYPFRSLRDKHTRDASMHRVGDSSLNGSIPSYFCVLLLHQCVSHLKLSLSLCVCVWGGAVGSNNQWESNQACLGAYIHQSSVTNRSNTWWVVCWDLRLNFALDYLLQINCTGLPNFTPCRKLKKNYYWRQT